MPHTPLAGRKTDELFATGVPQTDADMIRDAVDAAFEHVLHARFAGGMALLLVAEGGREATKVLRPAPPHEPSYLVLQFTLSDKMADEPAHPMHHVTRHAVTFGSFERPAPDASPAISSMTEIIDEHDPNEAADGTLLAGVTLVTRGSVNPRNIGDDTLTAERTHQGLQDGSSTERQGSRGQLPVKSRQNPSRQQGLVGANGRSRSLSPQVQVPVGRALLHAIEQALGFSSWPPTPVVNILAAVSPGVI